MPLSVFILADLMLGKYVVLVTPFGRAERERQDKLQEIAES